MRESGQPFFMIVSYLNPHDIMYADANVPGTPQAQKAVSNDAIVAPPKNSLYSKRWKTAPSPTLQESLIGCRNAGGAVRIPRRVGAGAWRNSHEPPGYVGAI